MTVYYLDTSAILKRYRSEKGTDVIADLYEKMTDRDALLTSQFSCLEIESVASRALKGRVLNQQAYDALLGALSHDIGNYLLLLPVSDETVTNAIGAVRNYAVRAADAMHIAAAQTGSVQVTGGGFVFVASDRELLAAAEAAGMETLNPEMDGALESLAARRQ